MLLLVTRLLASGSFHWKISGFNIPYLKNVLVLYWIMLTEITCVLFYRTWPKKLQTTLFYRGLKKNLERCSSGKN